MNLNNIFHEISKFDPEVYEKTSDRRDVIRRWGKGMALAAVPTMLSSLFNKTYAQSTGAIVDVLNFALTLEYLERNFYQEALEAPDLIPSGAPTGAITTIRDHEADHVTVLIATIQSLNGTPIEEPTFDFTAGGAFSTVFTDYDVFLAVSQAFEDTGVRAYKGQAANLMSNDTVLEAALNIHSVEARHASHIRQMRKARGADVKPWITQRISGITGAAGNAVAPVYEGEQATTQAGVNIASLSGSGVDITSNAASEAFDEPLTKEQVTSIASLFIVQNP